MFDIRIRFIMLPLFIFLLIAQVSYGKGFTAGKITKIEGAVSIIRADGGKIQAKPYGPLYAGDRIVTGKGASVWFTLEGNRLIKLGADSQVAVDELSDPEVEDDSPSLRLIVGRLWAKIEKLAGKTPGMKLHTATCVLGVRGTEFETVVALDAASVITVDEGSIEVDVDDRNTLVNQGKMLEVEMDGKAAPPVDALPKDQRDWEAWRAQRSQRLLKHLPQMVPRFAERFNRAVFRLDRFSEKISRKAEELRKSIERFRQARAEGNRIKGAQAAQQLKKEVQEFKAMLGKFRQGANRVLLMSRFAERLENFTNENKALYSTEALTAIESNLVIISKRGEELRTLLTNTFGDIRGIFRELRALRAEAP
ncbi:MAG: FecR domain-containing protein [Deltaproteobacteria bacterium]|nr:FecR domain-containing protein [Deltaproteobacteria bacterium]